MAVLVSEAMLHEIAADLNELPSIEQMLVLGQLPNLEEQTGVTPCVRDGGQA